MTLTPIEVLMEALWHHTEIVQSYVLKEEQEAMIHIDGKPYIVSIKPHEMGATNG